PPCRRGKPMSKPSVRSSASDELWSLVEALVDGQADDTQRAQLESRLRTDPDARQFYVEYLDLHAQLQWRTRGKSDGLAGPRLPVSRAPVRRTSRQLILASLAAVASLAMAAAVFVALFVPRSLP